MASQVRQNFHADCEDFINKQINLELYSSYVYLSMAYYFDRDDVALPGMYKFFKDNSEEEREHADALMKLQNKRGGRIVLKDIEAPSPNGDWESTLNALTCALALEKKVNQSLLDLHKISSNRVDPHLTDCLESKFLDEQVESIKKIGCMITQVKRAGPEGLGEYIFDKHQQS